MSLIFGYEPKPLRNLSASRIDSFDACVAKLFYESLLRVPQLPVHPAGLMGNALHYINEMLIQRMLKDGPLPLAEKDEVVKAWTGFVWAVFLGTEVIPGKKPQSVNWLSPWELEKLDGIEQLKLIEQKRGEYIRKAKWAIEAFYYLCTRGTTAIKLETEKEYRVKISSTIERGLGIPVIAYIDLLAEFMDGRVVVFDWKTGKRSNLEHKLLEHVQMLLYAHIVFGEKKVVPETYIVSLEVFPSDLQKSEIKQLQEMLMRPPFLMKVPIQYFKQIGDLIQKISEQWYVLHTIISPPKNFHEVVKAGMFQPQSHSGRLLNYEKHVQERRPVPNVGSPTCNFCSVRLKCEQDNWRDWKKLHLAHRMVDFGIENLPPQILAPIVAKSIPALEPGMQNKLFDEAPKSAFEKKIIKQCGKYNWPAAGFRKIGAKSSKEEKKIFKLLPRHWTGVICQCIDGKWLWQRLIQLYPLVVQEEKDYKDWQREQRAIAPKKAGAKIQSLRESKWINALLSQCPINECVHRCNPHPKGGNGINPTTLIAKLVKESEMEEKDDSENNSRLEPVQ